MYGRQANGEEPVGTQKDDLDGCESRGVRCDEDKEAQQRKQQFGRVSV